MTAKRWFELCCLRAQQSLIYEPELDRNYAKMGVVQARPRRHATKPPSSLRLRFAQSHYRPAALRHVLLLAECNAARQSILPGSNIGTTPAIHVSPPKPVARGREPPAAIAFILLKHRVLVLPQALPQLFPRKDAYCSIDYREVLL
jgi:hypothetical protein